MRALFVCGAAVVVGLAVAEQGRSCTTPVALWPTEPRAVVAQADAVFTGTLIAVRPQDPAARFRPAPHVVTFAVDEWHKGGEGDRVEAVNWLDGSCGGIDATVGRRGSYLLSRHNSEWNVVAVAPEILRRGLLPWPQPTGSGRAAFVAGGHFGLLRTALLDARGRTLAYGMGRGAVTALSVCPGGKVVVELVWVEESVRMALRALPSLRVLRETEIREAGFGETVVCRSRTGSDVIAGVQVREQPEWETQVIHISPVGIRIVERASRLALAVHGKQVFVSVSGGRLVVHDLETGSRRTKLRTTQLLTGMSISPDARLAAGFAGETLVTVDLQRRTTKARAWRGSLSHTRWTGRRTFAAWSRGSGRLEVLDPQLRTLSPAWTWSAHTTTAGSSGLFGVDWSGRLLTERRGSIVRLGRVFSPAVSVLERL